VLTVLNTAGEDEFAQLNRDFEALIDQARAQLEADGIPADKHRFRKIMECRYAGQGFELRADVPDEALGKDNVQQVIESFFDHHKQVYGHAFRDQLTEAITLRVVAFAEASGSLSLPDLARGGRVNPEEAVLYTRKTTFDDGKHHDTPRYARLQLVTDDVIHGPAIVVQHNSTTLVPPAWSARVMSHGDLHLSRA